MKKILSLFLLVGAFLFVWGGQNTTEAHAKTFSKSFANTLKQGRLPNTVGKVGTKFETIYYKLSGEVGGSESFNCYSTNDTTYYYEMETYDTIYYRQPTKAIEAEFIGNYSKTSIRKQLKPLAYKHWDGTYTSKSKTDLYKAGRFYAYIDKWGKNIRVIVSTKKAMKSYFQIDKIYE